MADEKPKVMRYDSYLAMIQNSIGAHMFRNLWAKVDGERKDVLQDGKLSCAVYVSSVLTLHKLIDGPHAIVRRTVEEMERAGWQKIQEAKPGAVVVWADREYDDGTMHPHIGFCVGNDEAVSTDYEQKEVVRHPLSELNGPREVESYWWHPELDA